MLVGAKFVVVAEGAVVVVVGLNYIWPVDY